MVYLLLLISILLGTFGQICLKFGVSGNTRMQLFHPLINEFIISALFLYGISLVFYTFAIRTVPIHIAFASISLSYVLVALASHYIWQTPFGLWEIIAFLLIATALSILVYSSSLSTQINTG